MSDSKSPARTDAAKNVDGEGPKAASPKEAEAKTYRVSNKQLGARGVETEAHGLVMVHPTAPGAPGTTTLTLTEDEVKRAKLVGLECRTLKNGTAIEHTADLPAAGYINPDHPDAEKLAEALHENHAKSLKHISEGTGGANLNAPIGGQKTDKKD
jgi:hypothetical protein